MSNIFKKGALTIGAAAIVGLNSTDASPVVKAEHKGVYNEATHRLTPEQMRKKKSHELSLEGNGHPEVEEFNEYTQLVTQELLTNIEETKTFVNDEIGKIQEAHPHIADALADMMQEASHLRMDNLHERIARLELSNQNGDFVVVEGEEETSDHHEDAEKKHNELLVYILSLMSLLYFANMMYRCAAHGESISFLKHHLTFTASLGVMATQLPHEIAEGLLESAIAFTAIMGITRMSRGVTNKKDFSQFTDEEAKAVIYLLGGLFGPLVNSLTTSTVLSPLCSQLKEKKDKYIAMQNISNLDGAIGLGAFPGLVSMNKLGPVNGPLYQLGLMLPIIAFQKIYQALLWKPKLIKHSGLIMDVIKGLRYDPKRLWGKHAQDEEMAMVKELFTELEAKLSSMKEVIGEDFEELQAAVQQGEATLAQEKSTEIVEYTRMQEVVNDLRVYIEGSAEAQDAAGLIAQELLQAIRDGHISPEEVTAIKDATEFHALLSRTPNEGKEALSGLAKYETLIEHKFHQLCKTIKASHNEAEIMKVFTVQAMAVPLLIPIVELALKKAPFLTEVFTGMTTAFADNYAAAATTWGVDPAKALSIAIAFGGATIYGNMPNLNFLGKHANLGDSLKAAKYLIPPALFIMFYLNSGAYKLPVEVVTGQKIEHIMNAKQQVPKPHPQKQWNPVPKS